MRFFPRSIQSRRDSIAVGKGHVFNHGVPDVKTAQDRSARYARGIASGTLTSAGAWTNGTTVTVGDVVYTILTVLVDAANNVLRGANEAATLLNLQHAINRVGGVAGTDFGTATVANPRATALSDGAHVLTVSAITPGILGNLVPLAASADATASAALLKGGC